MGISNTLIGLGMVALAQGDDGRAAALLQESLRNSRDIGSRDLGGESLEGLSWVVAAQGQPRRAAALSGAADALRAALAVPLQPDRRAEHDRAVDAMRAALGEEAFAAAWAEGRALPLDEAIALALVADLTDAEQSL
jgi:hypothetical protein